MRQASGSIEIETRQQGLVEVTREVERWVEAQGIEEGLLTLFCRHTSASLVVQELRSNPSSYFCAPTHGLDGQMSRRAYRAFPSRESAMPRWLCSSMRTTPASSGWASTVLPRT